MPFTMENACFRTGKMAQQGKALAAKPVDLDSISGTHNGRRGATPASGLLITRSEEM